MSCFRWPALLMLQTACAQADLITDSSPMVVTVNVRVPGQTIGVGETIAATASLSDQDGNLLDRPVVWSGSKNSVLRIGQDGVVTGIGPGTATITATSEGRRGSADLVVKASQYNVEMVGPRWIKAGVSFHYRVGQESGHLPATWSIGGSGRATITPDGVMTALGAGQFTVRAVVRDSLFEMEVESYDWLFTSDVFVTKVVLAGSSPAPAYGRGRGDPLLTISCAGRTLDVTVRYTVQPVSPGVLQLPAPVDLWPVETPDGTAYRFVPTAKLTTAALIARLSDAVDVRFGGGGRFTYSETYFYLTGMREAVAPVLAACR